MKHTAAHRLKVGNDYPYDAPDNWGADGRETNEHLPPFDWPHRAARGILADLLDRRGIKRGFEDIDHEVRVEIVEQMVEIMRAAALANPIVSDERLTELIRLWAKEHPSVVAVEDVPGTDESSVESDIFWALRELRSLRGLA